LVLRLVLYLVSLYKIPISVRIGESRDTFKHDGSSSIAKGTVDDVSVAYKD
jgi:hypothetical protein